MILDQFFISSRKSSNTSVDLPYETTLRSVVKSVSWRFIGTIDTVLISYILTGEINTAIAIGGVELVTKMVLYVAHERVWNRIKFGKKP